MSRFWGSVLVNLGISDGGAQMLPWCHGWCCKLPLIAFHFHIEFIKVWVHSHFICCWGPLGCYTCQGQCQVDFYVRREKFGYGWAHMVP
jgi:hypothetical protein